MDRRDRLDEAFWVVGPVSTVFDPFIERAKLPITQSASDPGGGARVAAARLDGAEQQTGGGVTRHDEGTAFSAWGIEPTSLNEREPGRGIAALMTGHTMCGEDGLYVADEVGLISQRGHRFFRGGFALAGSQQGDQKKAGKETGY